MKVTRRVTQTIMARLVLSHLLLSFGAELKDTVEKLGWLAFLGFTDEFPINPVVLSD
jgi:hypothetical protein